MILFQQLSGSLNSSGAQVSTTLTDTTILSRRFSLCTLFVCCFYKIINCLWCDNVTKCQTICCAHVAMMKVSVNIL